MKPKSAPPHVREATKAERTERVAYFGNRRTLRRWTLNLLRRMTGAAGQRHDDAPTPLPRAGHRGHRLALQTPADRLQRRDGVPDDSARGDARVLWLDEHPGRAFAVDADRDDDEILEPTARRVLIGHVVGTRPVPDPKTSL
jgi:hypothetical protein